MPVDLSPEALAGEVTDDALRPLLRERVGYTNDSADADIPLQARGIAAEVASAVDDAPATESVWELARWTTIVGTAAVIGESLAPEQYGGPGQSLTSRYQALLARLTQMGASSTPRRPSGSSSVALTQLSPQPAVLPLPTL